MERWNEKTFHHSIIPSFQRSLDAARKHHHGMHGVQKPELLHDEEPAETPGAGGVEKVLPAMQQAAGA
jgi:hypothetical protein